jgi:hypothetical protein
MQGASDHTQALHGETLAAASSLEEKVGQSREHSAAARPLAPSQWLLVAVSLNRQVAATGAGRCSICAWLHTRCDREVGLCYAACLVDECRWFFAKQGQSSTALQ